MWLQSTSASERRALLATYLGYGLDGFDLMIYSFIIPTLLTLWSMSKAQAGYIASGALITSAVGGWAAGVLADRFGRARILQLTVLWFAVFTFLSGFAHNFRRALSNPRPAGIGFWRRMGGGLGVGGRDHRCAPSRQGNRTGAKQLVGRLGGGGRGILGGERHRTARSMAWKILFWLGILPALLVVYIRRNVPEPAIFTQMRARRAGAADEPARRGVFLDIFRPPLLRTTLLATLLSTGMMGAYYSITTWLPTYLGERTSPLGERRAPPDIY